MVEPKTAGTVAAAISDGLVHLHKEYYGKGPTKTKTYLVDDTVVCMLRGGFTVVERTLIDEGRAEAVHDVRRVFQTMMKARFTEIVEAATGREVIAYMSQVHSDPDLALEVFVLEPGTDSLEGEHETEVED
jgi:uncharacterized protein YbcI